MNDNRMKVLALGIELGTASGWDDMEVGVFFFYDFEPAENCPISSGGINVNFTTGLVEVYDTDTDTDGNEISTHNLMDVLNAIGHDGIRIYDAE